MSPNRDGGGGGRTCGSPGGKVTTRTTRQKGKKWKDCVRGLSGRRLAKHESPINKRDESIVDRRPSFRTSELLLVPVRGAGTALLQSGSMRRSAWHMFVQRSPTVAKVVLPREVFFFFCNPKMLLAQVAAGSERRVRKQIK